MDRVLQLTTGIGLLTLSIGCQHTATVQAKKTMSVEAACGQCQFDQPGSGCDLAIRIEERVYFVDGSGIDDHGDAHGTDGFCNAVRHAEVTGSIENDRFVTTSFVLLPEEEDR